jgi:multicomponent Na+:H+ antiporter subunit G
MTILAAVLLLAGLFFLAVSAIGLLRMPDFYSRMHASSVSETMGAILVLLGVVAYQGIDAATIKVLLIVLFYAVASPTGAHALFRSALKSGLEMWSAEKENKR